MLTSTRRFLDTYRRKRFLQASKMIAIRKRILQGDLCSRRKTDKGNSNQSCIFTLELYSLLCGVMGVSLWVVFRKINKMMCSGDKEWTDKLQPAALAANTQNKRSTGYTPFYLMFGREFDSSKLLNIVTSPTNPSLNAQPIIESNTELSPPNLTPMEIDDVTDPYEIPN